MDIDGYTLDSVVMRDRGPRIAEDMPILIFRKGPPRPKDEPRLLGKFPIENRDTEIHEIFEILGELKKEGYKITSWSSDWTAGMYWGDYIGSEDIPPPPGELTVWGYYQGSAVVRIWG